MKVQKKFLKFNIKQKNNNEMVINTDQLKNGVIFESVCDVASGKGQFNIYRKQTKKCDLKIC